MAEHLNTHELALLNDWQHGFPLISRPFTHIAVRHDLPEQDVLNTYIQAEADGLLSRIGTILAPNTIGASTLAAMSVMDGYLELVAELVNEEPGVNHNYERENTLNLWFVVTGADRDAVDATLQRIEQKTGLPVYAFRLQRAYHLDLGFSLTDKRSAPKAPRPGQANLSCLQADDRPLLQHLENGLPLVAEPFHQIAAELGRDEEDILARLQCLSEHGIIRRFGTVLHHRRFGFRSNAMAVWDIADDRINDVAAQFACHPQVTLCYERNRVNGVWPYNLYCMVHAGAREDALAVLDELAEVAGDALNGRDVLFSRRCFKQRGATLTPVYREAAE
ncbi:siroheme decarboxylase subunit beta [Coralliovum pocilloporae]|uniref:siroheme decarboxylase subunit beta n=1 Tax=Coralliovum pocilloporae TaxID=3066369 RepID=UPI00330700DF